MPGAPPADAVPVAMMPGRTQPLWHRRRALSCGHCDRAGRLAPCVAAQACVRGL